MAVTGKLSRLIYAERSGHFGAVDVLASVLGAAAGEPLAAALDYFSLAGASGVVLTRAALHAAQRVDRPALISRRFHQRMADAARLGAVPQDAGPLGLSDAVADLADSLAAAGALVGDALERGACESMGDAMFILSGILLLACAPAVVRALQGSAAADCLMPALRGFTAAAEAFSAQAMRQNPPAPPATIAGGLAAVRGALAELARRFAELLDAARLNAAARETAWQSVVHGSGRVRLTAGGFEVLTRSTEGFNANLVR